MWMRRGATRCGIWYKKNGKKVGWKNRTGEKEWAVIFMDINYEYECVFGHKLIWLIFGCSASFNSNILQSIRQALTMTACAVHLFGQTCNKAQLKFAQLIMCAHTHAVPRHILRTQQWSVQLDHSRSTVCAYERPLPHDPDERYRENVPQICIARPLDNWTIQRSFDGKKKARDVPKLLSRLASPATLQHS